METLLAKAVVEIEMLKKEIKALKKDIKTNGRTISKVVHEAANHTYRGDLDDERSPTPVLVRRMPQPDQRTEEFPREPDNASNSKHMECETVTAEDDENLVEQG